MEHDLAVFDRSVSGMTCVNCARGIEKRLRELGGVDVAVSFADHRVRFRADHAQLPTLTQEIRRLGYDIEGEGTVATPLRRVLGSVEAKALICLLFTLPLLVGHVVPSLHFLHNPMLQLGLSTPVYAIGLAFFGRSAIGSLRAGVPNMDVLIVVGITAAYVYSTVGLVLELGGDYLFFESAAAIVTFVLIGNVIEHRSVAKMSSAVQELVKLQPTTARRLQGNFPGAPLSEVPAASLLVGDLVLVNTGDRIPADGTVTWGSLEVNESMLTGESMPIAKGVGASVIGGSVVESGSAKVRVTANLDASVLSGIVNLVQRAQDQRPNIQRLGDAVSAVFVPIVGVISLLTFVISSLVLGVSHSESLMRAIAVLVVACPCAMGLATPTAVMVAVGRAARMGILFKGGDTFERIAPVGTVVFDKTGTLTSGDFIVTSITPYGAPRELIDAAIVGLEQHSAHPIAKSLRANLKGVSPLVFPSIEETRGIGVQGVAEDGTRWRVNSSRHIGDNGALTHDLLLLRDDVVVAGIDLEDAIRAGAEEVIATLKAMRIEPVLLSGDRAAVCQRVADALHISSVHAEKMPEEKLSIIDQLERSSPTMYVGDGINDAPALSRANVGVALSDGTGAALQAAHMVLLGGGVSKLPSAIRLSSATLRTIKQNLFWAFFYNTLAIPLAAAGYLTPMVAAICMGLSDICVIGNSLLLRSKRL